MGRRARIRLLAGLFTLAVVAGVVLVAVPPWLGTGSGRSASTSPPVASAPAGSGTATPSASSPPSGTAGPTPASTPLPLVASTTSGLLFGPEDASRATREPIAVMIDDQAAARPQAGLAEADVVYQAPAEGGIPRYLAIFQTADVASIGPVRSSRLYFVAWAGEWRALYAHVGGAPNALAYLRQVNGKLVWDADEFQWGGSAGYLSRVTWRPAPHNVYTSTDRLRALAARLGAPSTAPPGPWTFAAPAPLPARPVGGTIIVPYPADRIGYAYDRPTDTYLRSATDERAETDQGTGARVAPSNVVVLFESVGPLANSYPGSTNVLKGRLEIDYLAGGRALVFTNGQAIEARWSKASDADPTLLTYASGAGAGQPVVLTRGQTFVQVVPTTLTVTWTTGTSPEPDGPNGLMPGR